MSKSSDQDFDLELHFLPAWAQKPAQETRYADYGGARESRPDDRRERGRDRGPGGPRPQRRREGERPRGQSRPVGSPAEAQGPRPQRGGDRRGGERGKGQRFPER